MPYEPPSRISRHGQGAIGDANKPRQLGEVTAAAVLPLLKRCHQPPENESSHPASKSAASSCSESIAFGKRLKIPRKVYQASAVGGSWCPVLHASPRHGREQPGTRARPGEKLPGFERFFIPCGNEPALGPSSPVPRQSRRAVSQLVERLFLLLFLHFSGPLDDSFTHNSSFKEAVFADGRSNTSVTLATGPAAHTPAVGRAVPKLTQLSPPERTVLGTHICFLKALLSRSKEILPATRAPNATAAGLVCSIPVQRWDTRSLQCSAILHKPRLQAPYSTGHSSDLHSSITRRSSQSGTSRAEVSIPSSSIL